MNERAKIAKYHEIMWNGPPFLDNLMVLAIWKASMIFIEALCLSRCLPPRADSEYTGSNTCERREKNIAQ